MMGNPPLLSGNSVFFLVYTKEWTKKTPYPERNKGDVKVRTLTSRLSWAACNQNRCLISFYLGHGHSTAKERAGDLCTKGVLGAFPERLNSVSSNCIDENPVNVISRREVLSIPNSLVRFPSI